MCPYVPIWRLITSWLDANYLLALDCKGCFHNVTKTLMWRNLTSYHMNYKLFSKFQIDEEQSALALSDPLLLSSAKLARVDTVCFDTRMLRYWCFKNRIVSAFVLLFQLVGMSFFWYFSGYSNNSFSIHRWLCDQAMYYLQWRELKQPADIMGLFLPKLIFPSWQKQLLL